MPCSWHPIIFFLGSRRTLGLLQQGQNVFVTDSDRCKFWNELASSGSCMLHRLEAVMWTQGLEWRKAGVMAKAASTICQLDWRISMRISMIFHPRPGFWIEGEPSVIAAWESTESTVSCHVCWLSGYFTVTADPDIFPSQATSVEWIEFAEALKVFFIWVNLDSSSSSLFHPTRLINSDYWMSGGHKSATVSGLRSWRSWRSSTLNATELEELLGAGLKAVAARLRWTWRRCCPKTHPLMIFGGLFICLNGMKSLR